MYLLAILSALSGITFAQTIDPSTVDIGTRGEKFQLLSLSGLKLTMQSRPMVRSAKDFMPSAVPSVSWKRCNYHFERL